MPLPLESMSLGRCIFFSPKDRQILNDLTAEVIERLGARLHAYCHMITHLHALIQIGDAPLGRLILRIAGRGKHWTRLSRKRAGSTR